MPTPDTSPEALKTLVERATGPNCYDDLLAVVKVFAEERRVTRDAIDAWRAATVALSGVSEPVCSSCAFLTRDVERLSGERDTAVQQKDAAYAERNKLVAALSKVLPSHLARHPDSDTTWEHDWRTIVVVYGWRGQMTWHIHDSERPMFAHLVEQPGFTWDGHTTEEKYGRLEHVGRGECIELVRSPSQ